MPRQWLNFTCKCNQPIMLCTTPTPPTPATMASTTPLHAATALSITGLNSSWNLATLPCGWSTSLASVGRHQRGRGEVISVWSFWMASAVNNLYASSMLGPWGLIQSVLRPFISYVAIASRTRSWRSRVAAIGRRQRTISGLGRKEHSKFLRHNEAARKR